jgi:prolipoprotein diacylglyceryl transferase
MAGLISVIASIPSPSFNSIDIGPLHLRLYGLMIGLGIIAATWLTRPRAEARRIHPDTVVELLVWVVPAGIVGARIYHIVTDRKPIGEWLEIWKGGLGIPGGILLGVVAGLVFMKVRELPRATMLDVLIPGVPLAQAIGRWGNWWNQELYGRPTNLPWGLEIDRPPARYDIGTTFHPTFLYESLWNLALVALLLWIDKRKVLKVGKLIWVYTGGYAIGRLWIESLRIDPASEIFGVRINLWTMGIVLALSLFMLRDWRREPSAAVVADASPGDEMALVTNPVDHPDEEE